MRPLVTWLVVGALALLGLFAARDALRTESSAGRPAAQRGPGWSPFIPGRPALAAALKDLDARGSLWLFDVQCRRSILRLPDLRWTAAGTATRRDCSGGAAPAVDPRFGLTASQAAADTIEIGTEGWHHRFRGTAPTFKPGGTPTFVRDGRLYEWSVLCPRGAPTVAFRALRTVERCERPVAGAPKSVREVVWLAENDYAALAGPQGAAALVVVRDGRKKLLFTSVGSRLGALAVSPTGRYLTARLDGALALFRTNAVGTRPLPPGASLARSIGWGTGDRLAAVATESFVFVFETERPESAVLLPLSAAAVNWR